MQDVPEALQRKGLVFACYMDPAQEAIVDAEYMVRVNYETYLFASSTARELFRTDIVRYCGLVTDPVTKRRFRPHDASPYAEHEGVRYYFERIADFEMFLAHPEPYVLPGYTM